MLHIKIFSFTQILLEDPLYFSLTLIFDHQSDFWHERQRCSRLLGRLIFMTIFLFVSNGFYFEFLSGYFSSFCNFSHFNLALRFPLFFTTGYQAFYYNEHFADVICEHFLNLGLMCPPNFVEQFIPHSCIILTHRLILSYANRQTGKLMTSCVITMTHVKCYITVPSG